MSVTVPDIPGWLQNGIYPARIDRQLIDAMWNEGIVSGLAVSPRAEGANFSVDVAAGFGVVHGDDQTGQGAYLISLGGKLNAPIGVPSAQGRIDLVTLQINDPQAGGRTGDNAAVVVVAGTPGTTPVAPALPASAIELARVTVASNAVSVGTTAIDSSKRVSAYTRSPTPLVPTSYRTGSASVPASSTTGIAPSTSPQATWTFTSSTTLTIARAGVVSVGMWFTRVGSIDDQRGHIDFSNGADPWAYQTSPGGTVRGFCTWQQRVNVGETIQFIAQNLKASAITLTVDTRISWLGP